MHNPPVNFLVVGRARSGSTWLCEGLASHRSVCVHDEPLNKESLPLSAPADLPGFFRSLLVTTEPSHRAVGVKLLYDQFFLNDRHPGFLLPYWGLDAVEQEGYLKLRRRLVEERLLAAWPLAHLRRQFRLLRRTIAQDRTLRVIHIRRRDIVRAHLSVVVATRFSWVGQPREEGPIRLRPEALRRVISRTRRCEAMVRRLFRGHPYREVFYEDLVANPTCELSRIARFLDLSDRDFAPTPAHEQRPLALEVANLGELRAALPGEWTRAMGFQRGSSR